MEDHSFSFGKIHDFRSPKATKSSLKTVLLEKVRDGVCLVSDSSRMQYFLMISGVKKFWEVEI